MTRWDDDSIEVPEADQTLRRGGAQGEGETAVATNDEEAKRQALAAKKAEVRKRLEEAGKKGKKKKGFLTPERKKKLRKLLMMKAAENLKHQQAKQDQERNSALSSRIPACPDLDKIEDKGQLEKIYNDLFQKLLKLEEEKYDINFQVAQKDAEINEMSIQVNDLRGKFVKPPLKKVSKYENRFRKTVGEEVSKPKEDFRSKLKTVEKKNVMEVLESKQKSKAEKPEWSKKGDEKAAGARRASAASSKAEEQQAPPPKKEPEPEPPAEEEEEGEEEVGEEEEEEE